MAIGLCLIALELVSTTFLSLLLGVSALLVGVLLYILPDLSQSTLFLLWGIFSVISTGLWFRFFKPQAIRVSLSTAELEMVTGTEGTVIRHNRDRKDGIVRFTIPVLDRSEWPFFSENPVKEGDRVVIIGFDQNHFIVAPKSGV